MPKTSVVQIKTGGLDDNFSYLAYAQDGAALIVDPCGDANAIRLAVEKAATALRPEYILLTHGHRDHYDALKEVLAFFPAPLAAHESCKVPCQIRVSDGTRLPFGGLSVICHHTPGHSPDSVCYELSDGSALFTGDTLFIDCCGYCEPSAMFETMRTKLSPLPDSLPVYSGHDYGHAPFDSLGAQKRSNPFLLAKDLHSFREELKKL